MLVYGMLAIMSGEFRENTQEPSQRLATIEHHFDTPLDPNVVEFSHLLSDRLNPELVPMGFVMAGNLMTYDLQTGRDGFTSEPIDSSLVHQSPELYEQLQTRLPALAEFAFSCEFAGEVSQIIEKITGKPVANGKTVEEALAQPIEAQQYLSPNTLPDAGKVEVAAELEDGTKLYVDQELILLGNEFDPSTYNSPLGSAYGDYSLEMLVHPIVGLGAANGQYFGVDKDGLDKLINPDPRFTTFFEPDNIPDLRTAEVDGKTIYFPTARMLENMGVTRRGVEAPEAATAGILSYLMKNSTLGDETPAKEEFVPEVDLPGLDPFDIVRSNGELPEKGLLLEAKMARGGNAVFTIYDYDNLERMSIDEQGEDGEYQYLHPSFSWDDGSKAREIEFSYEQPGYFDKDVQPFNRSDVYSYMGCSFADLDVIELAGNGRLLISKQPRRLGNLSTRLDQTPWKNNFLNGQTRNLVRWFPAGEVDGLSEAVEIITGGLLGIDPRAAQQIKQGVADRLTAAKSE